MDREAWQVPPILILECYLVNCIIHNPVKKKKKDPEWYKVNAVKHTHGKFLHMRDPIHPLHNSSKFNSLATFSNPPHHHHHYYS